MRPSGGARRKAAAVSTLRPLGSPGRDARSCARERTSRVCQLHDRSGGSLRVAIVSDAHKPLPRYSAIRELSVMLGALSPPHWRQPYDVPSVRKPLTAPGAGAAAAGGVEGGGLDTASDTLHSVMLAPSRYASGPSCDSSRLFWSSTDCTGTPHAAASLLT